MHPQAGLLFISNKQARVRVQKNKNKQELSENRNLTVVGCFTVSSVLYIKIQCRAVSRIVPLGKKRGRYRPIRGRKLFNPVKPLLKDQFLFDFADHQQR